MVMMGPYLTNSGKFLDASALFGGTIRLAQSIGCMFNIFVTAPIDAHLTWLM